MADSRAEFPAIPLMSGALPNTAARPQSSSGSNDQSFVDHVHSEYNANLDDRGLLAPFPPSFFTGPDGPFQTSHMHAEPNNGRAPHVTNHINASQTHSTLKSRQSGIGYGRRPQESSLDEILRHGSNGHVVREREAQVPLPESRSSRNTTEYTPSISGDVQSKSSLEVVMKRGFPFHPPNPSPSSIPLPDSRTISIEETRGSNPIHENQPIYCQTPIQEYAPQQQYEPPTPFSPQWPPTFLFPYEHMIKQACDFLTHIEHGRINMQPLHEFFGNISYIDYSWVPGAVTNPYRLRSQHETSFFSTLGNIPDHVKQRVIVVEDLCPRTINHLGRLFGVSPEFFEEHLINSGYGGPDYNDQPSQTWTTSGMRKSYISMRWHRPVIRLLTVPLTDNDRKELLDPKIGRTEYNSKTSRHPFVYRTETNILRSEWTLWTDPAITRKERQCGWEERVSVWSQKPWERDCQIGNSSSSRITEIFTDLSSVIILLDPLPKIQEAVEKDSFMEESEDKAPDFEKNGSSQSLESAQPPSHQSQRPLESLDRPVETLQKHELIRDVKPTWARKFMKRLTGRNTGIALDIPKRIEPTKKLERKRSQNLFRHYAHRTHLEMNYDDAFRLPSAMDAFRQQLSETRSTSEDLWQRLLTPNAITNDSGEFEGVVEPIFRIVYQDSISLMKLIHNALDAINMDILDDVKMEERLSIWRQLITRAQLELPELKQSATQFLSFFHILDSKDDHPTPKNHENGLKESNKHSILIDMTDLCQRIDSMMQRLQTASSALTSNMALLDSRRSIAEAQAVTKLTELAFFFIPLGFAATLFGMQIEQFENRAPLWVFVVTGLGFVTASYLVRLIIRSTWLRDLIGASKSSIKIYADSKRIPVKRGSVPASLFVAWTAHEFNGIAKVIFDATWRILTERLPRMLSKLWQLTKFIIAMSLIISIPAAAPIAVLWTRDINHGAKIMITIVILICIIGIFGVPYWRNADPEVRSALPSLLKRKVKPFLSETSITSVFNVVLCAIVIGIILLAVIWTRPIAPGIRAAITVFIVLIFILSIIAWGIYRLVMIARRVDSSSGSISSRSLVEG